MRAIDPADFRRARELKGWSQRQLGALISRSQQWVALLEADKVRTNDASVARLLAVNLDLDPEAVFAHISRAHAPESAIASRADGEP